MSWTPSQALSIPEPHKPLSRHGIKRRFHLGLLELTIPETFETLLANTLASDCQTLQMANLYHNPECHKFFEAYARAGVISVGINHAPAPAFPAGRVFATTSSAASGVWWERFAEAWGKSHTLRDIRTIWVRCRKGTTMTVASLYCHVSFVAVGLGNVNRQAWV
jgi:hypothetical protein